MNAVDLGLLRRVALFAQLPGDDLADLAASLRRRRYNRGQVIFSEGDPGRTLCLVETGRVHIVASSPEGRELVLNTLGPGDAFGELALLDGEPRSANAIAQEDCQLLHLARDDFRRFVEGRPGVALALLAVLSRWLRRATQRAQDVAFLDVPARLARVLLELAERPGAPSDAGPPTTPRITQTDLAGLVGTTRESVNKWLAAFERQGLVRRQGGAVALLRPAALRERIY